MRIQEEKTLYEKLKILTDAAKYDVACTSSGTSRRGDGTGMGNCEQASATAFQQMDAVFPFLRFYLRMSVSTTANTALTADPTMWSGLPSPRMRSAP